MRIARILGIEVVIHPSWLFVFAFVTWWLSSDIGPLRYLGLSPFQRIVLGTLGPFPLWFVLLRDLTHALARSRRPGRGCLYLLTTNRSRDEAEPDAGGAELPAMAEK
jgi:hypothetical protein